MLETIFKTDRCGRGHVDHLVRGSDEAVHGMPGDRILHPGDLVRLDLVAEKDGCFADVAGTMGVSEISATADALVRCAERPFQPAAKAARTGYRIDDIGRAVDREPVRCGVRVMPEPGGHGVGRTIHEPPPVSNYPDPSCWRRLAEGLVITIDPIIAVGTGRGTLGPEGWIIRTADGTLSHYQHTVVIRKRAPICSRLRRNLAAPMRRGPSGILTQS